MIDFLVIGGGVAGLSAGARLSEIGSVHVLEAEDALGYHASGRSAALFEATYGKPTTVALNRAGAGFFRDGGYLSDRGLMMLAGAEDDRAAFETELDLMEMERITGDEARELVPILDPARIVAAGHHGEAWDIDTDRLLQDFARAVRRAGGQVTTGARVTAIRRNAAGWQVDADGLHEARVIVNAAGAWADPVAKMAGVAPLGLTPLRRSMARLPAPGGHDVGGWPMILGAGESWYAKPDAGALLVSPAEEDPSEPMDAWADDMVLAEGLARYETFVTEPVTRLLSNWAGLRTFAPDRSLVIGPDPTAADFVWFAGQGGYGFQTAPAASRLLADLLGGRAPELEPETVAGLSPARLR